MYRMNDTEYKRYHESFMENNHGSTVIRTFLYICFSVLCAVFCAIRNKRIGSRLYVFEYLVIVVPMIIAHTVLTGRILLMNVTISFCIIDEIYKNLHKFEFQKVFESKNIFKSNRMGSVSCMRGLTYLITGLCILAVDFRAFPRRMAKTEKYGFSVMDTGVGLFVMMSGLVQKPIDSNYISEIRATIKFTVMSVFLGTSRYLTLNQLDYQQHVTEYGLHWNFFFTLAVCKSISLILLLNTDETLICSIAVLLLHEYLLLCGLQDWVFSGASRITLSDANREGISSCLGYVALYMFAVHLRKVVMDSTVKRYTVIIKLVFGATFLWILTFYVHEFRPASRVLANAGYCIYLEAILLTIMTILYIFEVLYENKRKKLYFDVPLILNAINQNGLLYFLIVNIATGVVNMCIRTLFVPLGPTFLILNAYMIITIALTVILLKLGIKL